MKVHGLELSTGILVRVSTDVDGNGVSWQGLNRYSLEARVWGLRTMLRFRVLHTAGVAGAVRDVGKMSLIQCTGLQDYETGCGKAGLVSGRSVTVIAVV